MLMQPATIGRYEIRAELGQGSMGIVYEAHDPLLRREIALKTIRPLAGTPDDLQAYETRFFAEARAAARLSHPGIVIVHDVGRDAGSGVLFIALERLRGQTLAERLRGGARLPWREAAAITARLAQALDHAHRNGVVHRDVKPENVMLLAEGEPKLMDFGIAKLDTASLTAAGQVFGTPRYMSPEQASALPVDARSDIFSLGAVAYLALTGRGAFDAPSVPAILARILHDESAPPSSLVDGLPPALDAVLARTLAKAPEARYQSGRALGDDLDDVLAGRPPRHAGLGHAEAAPLPQPAGASDSPLAGLLDAARAAREATLTAGPELAASAAAAGRWQRVALGLGGLLVAAAFAGAVWLGRPQPAPARPAPASQTPPPVAPALEAAAPEAPAPAYLVVDFEHSIRSGTLKIWLDEELVVDEALSGQVTRKLLVLKGRSGAFVDKLEVEPGRHELKVEVRWEGERRTRSAAATFRPGATRRLDARLGGLLKKDLSLEWG
ncbi:MAG: serine/threonine-protein kinase [Vicinamibacteria bacterium]